MYIHTIIYIYIYIRIDVEKSPCLNHFARLSPTHQLQVFAKARDGLVPGRTWRWKGPGGRIQLAIENNHFFIGKPSISMGHFP